MALRIKVKHGATVEFRGNKATSDDGGTYHIAELALVENIDGNDYIKSVGATYRNDEISEDLRTIQRAEAAADRRLRDEQALRARDVLSTPLPASEQQRIDAYVDDCVDNNKELYPEHPVTGQPVVDATPAVAAAAVL